MVMFKVYRIRFDDGSEYIGSTYRNPNERLAEHRTQGDNGLLHSKFVEGVPYTFTVLSEHKYRADAVAAEREHVLKAEHPINVYLPSISGFGRKLQTKPRGKFSFRHKIKKRNVAPGMGYYICSKCRERKHGEEFQADRSRFNGRYSQCRVCQKKAREARIQRLRDEGLCMYCGKQPATASKTQCPDCQAKNKQYWLERRDGITRKRPPPSVIPPAIDHARQTRGDRLRANYQQVLREMHEQCSKSTQ